MRDWGWEDRAEWTAQSGYGREEQRPRNHSGNQKAPVWGEWDSVTEDYFGTVIWEWYGERMRRLEERKQEKEWGEQVKMLLPLLISLTEEIGRTPAVEGAIQRLLGRKPKSRVALASGELVATWRTMTVEEIIDHAKAHIMAQRHPEQGEVVETRVASSGTIPQNNPFAALKGKF